jgi:hypothetical protein
MHLYQYNQHNLFGNKRRNTIVYKQRVINLFVGEVFM